MSTTLASSAADWSMRAILVVVAVTIIGFSLLR